MFVYVACFLMAHSYMQFGRRSSLRLTAMKSPLFLNWINKGSLRMYSRT